MIQQSTAWLVVSFVLSGCVLQNVPELEPEGKKIKLVREADKPLDCEVVADISGTARAEDEKEAKKGAENDIRNRAAQYEANFAVVEVERSHRAGTGPYKEVFLGGKATNCTTYEMQAKKEQQEAEAKERAEQEEAERARQEELERAKEEAEAEKEEKEGEDEE